MQKQKKEILDKILEVSRKEFISNGFAKTSMRTIAKNTGVSLSNIYNYFKNKDEIFYKILSPLLNEFKLINERHNAPEHITDEVFHSDEYQKNNIRMMLELVDKFRIELDLLFFKAEGSALANFKEKIIEDYTILGAEYLKKMKEKYPRLNADISEFFIHNASAWWVNILIEVVMHDLNEQQMEKFVTEYVTYSTSGWKGLMNA